MPDMDQKPEHEYNFSFRTPQGRMRIKLHSPWTQSFERLRRAEEALNADASDKAKLDLLLKLFCPHIYQFDLFKVNETEEVVDAQP